MNDRGTSPARGLTPRELARLLRVRPERVRAWIAGGELPAVNTAGTRCGKPRFVVLPGQLADFLRGRQAGPTPKARPRPKRTNLVDFYPDGEPSPNGDGEGPACPVCSYPGWRPGAACPYCGLLPEGFDPE